MRKQLSNQQLQQGMLKGFAVSCVIVFSVAAQADNCDTIYGVQDNAVADSQLVKIDPMTYVVEKCGSEHLGLDLEGLDITSDGELLVGSSGDEGKEPGSLYDINPGTCDVDLIGQICFEYDGQNICGTEISSISFHPKTGELSAWSEECGLVTVDLDNPQQSTLELPVSKDDFAACTGDEQARKDYTSFIEDISWDNTGKTLYYSNNKGQVFNHPSSDLELIGLLPKGNIETIEMLPWDANEDRNDNNDLMLVAHGQKFFKMMDADNGKVVKVGEELSKDYRDIEAVAACVTPEDDGTSSGSGSQEDGTSDGSGSQEDGTSDGSGSQEDGTSDGSGSQEDGTSDGNGSQEDGTSDGSGSQEDGTSGDTNSDENTPPVQACVMDDLTKDWTYTTDYIGDATGSNILEIFGMAIKQEAGTITVAINANMKPEDGFPYKKATGGNVNFTDLVLDFGDGTKYAVHFADNDNVGKLDGKGVYQGMDLKDVTKANAGWSNFNSYFNKNKSADLGDMKITSDNYFGGSWTASRTIPQSIVPNTGTKVANITILNKAGLTGLDESKMARNGNPGKYTFGFSFPVQEGMEGKFVSYVFTECINDGIAMENSLPSCPDSTTTDDGDISGANAIGGGDDGPDASEALNNALNQVDSAADAIPDDDESDSEAQDQALADAAEQAQAAANQFLAQAGLTVSEQEREDLQNDVNETAAEADKIVSIGKVAKAVKNAGKHFNTINKQLKGNNVNNDKLTKATNAAGMVANILDGVKDDAEKVLSGDAKTTFDDLITGCRQIESANDADKAKDLKDALPDVKQLRKEVKQLKKDAKKAAKEKAKEAKKKARRNRNNSDEE